MKNKYNLIISLGEDCACSMYLRKHNLQVKSYPFDWLTNASFETRLEMILNDFQNFLNLEDLKFLPKDPNVFNDKNCDYYENIKNGFYYYHEFPEGCPIQESFNKVKIKYERRIKRFYETIEKSEKVLFVWLSHTKNTNNDLIVSLHEKIELKFGKKIDFLIIENDSSKIGDETLITELADNLIKYNLDTASWDISNDKTLGNIKNCTRIFAQYELLEPFFEKICYRFKKILIKFVCIFIPVKSWRKNLRECFR